MAIAESPATPAPITKTFAGSTVPAAVVSMGKYLGSAFAATRTALYPAMFAMEERVSIDCARVMRGIRSVAKEVIRRAASLSTASGWRVGIIVQRRIAPSRIASTSCMPGEG